MVEKTFVVHGMERKEDARKVQEALLAVPEVEACEVDYRTGLCEVVMSAVVSTDILNRALDVLDGEYSLVVAESFADTGGSFFQGSAWIPLAIVGVVLALVIVGLLWYEFFG